jgi:hypothetical protein
MHAGSAPAGAVCAAPRAAHSLRRAASVPRLRAAPLQPPQPAAALPGARSARRAAVRVRPARRSGVQVRLARGVERRAARGRTF